MEDCTQVLDISAIGFDISDLGRVKVGTLIVDETSYEIYKGENVIGRDELSDIVLRNHSISNKHAVVEVEDWDTHLLFDCGSTNKTKLGTIFLKPNVRYNLQGGEDIMFANLKAKYIKLDKPETDRNDEDNISDAGSESILNSAPVDQEADLDIVNNDQPSSQVQDKNAEDDSRNGSNVFSDLNDSSLLEENQQKASSSKLQVVDASDDSTDDEIDFIPPSQTVKEFASKKQLALKNKYINDLSSDIFSTENAVLNTQEQEVFFMTEKTDCNKILNSPDLNTQSLFSSEEQESLKPKDGVTYDQSIFEAETQDSDFAVKNNDETGPRSRASREIFDAETEVPVASASGEDVVMSDLEFSNALTESNVATQKPDTSNTDKIKNEITSTCNIITNLVKIINPKDIPVSVIKQKAEPDDSTSVIISNVSNDKSNILKVKEETPETDHTGVITEQSEHLSQINNNSDVTDLSDVLTQVNTSLSTKSKTSSSNLDLGIDDICTQVNTSLKFEALENLVVKEEISIKEEFEDNLDFTLEETQLNTNIQKNKKINKNRRTSKPGHSRDFGGVLSTETDDTQLNLKIYSLFSESKEANITHLPSSHQQVENSITQDTDGDSTDVEDDNLYPGGQINMNNIVNSPTSRNIIPKTEFKKEMDGNSNQSDSLLASAPLDPELESNHSVIQNYCKTEKQTLKENDPELESKHSVIKNYCKIEKQTLKENCEISFNPNQPFRDEVLKNNQQDIATGDMDICSTIGDGTYLSACGSLRKAQNLSEMKINQFENSSKKLTSKSTKLFIGQKKVSETESLNHSMVFNEPCGSSTPFRTEERIIANYNNVKAVVVKTPPRGIFERVIDSPDLPCTDELIEVACKTPERQGTTPISESNKQSENLPLALKRTPRARKLSRKVAEALEEQNQKGVRLLPSTLVSNKSKNTKNAVVTDDVNGEGLDKFPENLESSKQIVKRKSIAQRKDLNEAEVGKFTGGSNEEVLKQNYCVKNLSVSLADINNSKSKKTYTKQADIEEHSPSKRAKNMDVEEHRVENPVKESVSKEISTDKRKKKHIDQLKFEEKKSERTIKTPSKQPKGKNGEFHGYGANLKEDESGGKPPNMVNKLVYKNKEKNTIVPESSTKNNLVSSSIKTNNTDVSQDRHGSSLCGEKLNTEIISGQPSKKQLKNIEENPTSEDQQCDKASMRTKLGSRSSTLSKSGQPIKGAVPNTVESSIMRKSNRAGVKKTSPKKELPTDLKTPENKCKSVIAVDMEVSNNDMIKHVIPLKRSKTVENPCNSNDQKSTENKTAEKKDQKSAEEVTEDAVKFTAHYSLGMKNIDNNGRQSKLSEKLTKAKGKEENVRNEEFSSENPNKYTIIPEANIRKSNRRKKEDIVDTSSKMESKDECKFGNTITKSTSELRSKSKSKDNAIEKPETATRKSSRTKKGTTMKSDIGKDTSESETHSKLLNKNNNTSNLKNKMKTKGRLLNESVEDGTLKTKSRDKESNEEMLENSIIVDDIQEKLTKCRKPTRSRVKPARFKDDIDGSNSSCIGSDIGPSLSKKRKSRHDSTSMEFVSSIMSGGDKSNEEHTVFIAPSKSTSHDAKKHSEVFKTPVVEDKSRSRRVGNEKSRSRSRSDSSQSSLKSDTSSIQSPRRLGARGKRVLFTSGLMNPAWESQVKKLGGSVVDCPVECSLLVADKVRRTVKFLCVLGQGKPIVSPDWLTQSWRCTSFIEPMDHLLIDKEAEDKFQFSLSQTIQAAGNQPLMEGYHVHATPSVKPPPEDIRSIVESCGGQYIEKVPSKWPTNIVIISHLDDKSLWKKFKVKGVMPPIVAAEMLLIGVLQHKLEVEPHRIS